MVDAEKARAEQAELERVQAVQKEAQDLAKKKKEEEKRQLLLKELTEEPTDGSIINIAFRLPNGTRLTRNFRQDEAIRVILIKKFMYAFLFTKEEDCLKGEFELFHDYPPVKIQESDLCANFATFFNHTDRQLITIHEANHH